MVVYRLVTVSSFPPGQDVDSFDPWGKPGAGAPLRDREGHVVATGVVGKHTSELERKSAHEKLKVDKTEARSSSWD